MKLVMECGPCDGDIGYARACVDEIAQYPGVAMKVQFYNANTLASPSAERYDHTDSRRISQHELFQNQLDYDQWAEVAEYAKSQGVEFFASVFDSEAIRQAYDMGVYTLKIASGDITHLPLIREAADMASGLIISTGGSTVEEINEAVESAGAAHGLILLACHLAYPSENRDASLHRVSVLKTLFGPSHQVGYSDHTPGLDTLPVLITLGASMWEKHFSVRPPSNTEGDHQFAIRPYGLDDAVEIIQETRALLGPRRIEPTPRELPARHGARRSLATAVPLSAGTLIDRESTTFLRPATGYSPAEADMVYGASARRDIPAGTIITPDMLA